MVITSLMPLAAQVGGLGIAPGANLGHQIGVFEATHGTAPDIAGQNIVNPTGLILSGALMLDYMGWPEAARVIREAIENTIASKQVTTGSCIPVQRRIFTVHGGIWRSTYKHYLGTRTKIK